MLTLPFTILTLGLFLLVLNATDAVAHRAAGGRASRIAGGFGTTILASIVLSLVGMVWKGLSRRTEPAARRSPARRLAAAAAFRYTGTR